MKYYNKLLLIMFLSVVHFTAKTQDNNASSFNNILLIINFNHAYYGNIDLLKKIYSPYFPNILFYGPQPDDRVIHCDHTYGWYSYKGIAHAMKNYPQYDGYLWVHDDCIINFWTFSKLSKNKIWLALPWASLDLSKGFEATQIANWKWKRNEYSEWLKSQISSWFWWNKEECGYPAIKKAYAQLPNKYINTLEENWGRESVLIGYSDIVYIPASFKDDFINVTEILNKNSVFLEIALPTICSSLDNYKNWELLKGIEFGDKQEYSKELNFLHPVKLSLKENQDFFSNIFAQYAATSIVVN